MSPSAGSCRCRPPRTVRWSTPKARIRPTSMMNATPKKNAMPRTAGLGAALLEGLVVEAVDEHAEDEEQRHQQHAGEDRIEPVARQQVGAVRAEHHDRRMRDVRHVEQAERDRQPDAHRGVEAAEQDAEQHRLEQQVERKTIDSKKRRGIAAPSCCTSSGLGLRRAPSRTARSRRRSCTRPGRSRPACPAGGTAPCPCRPRRGTAPAPRAGWPIRRLVRSGSGRRWSSSRSCAGSRRASCGRGSWWR